MDHSIDALRYMVMCGRRAGKTWLTQYQAAYMGMMKERYEELREALRLEDIFREKGTQDLFQVVMIDSDEIMLMDFKNNNIFTTDTYNLFSEFEKVVEEGGNPQLIENMYLES